MDIEDVNEKNAKFNNMEFAQMTYYMRPIVITKKTINGKIINKIEYGDTGEEVSEEECANVVNNLNSISNIFVEG